jgi:hypothetical protein
MKPVMQRGYRLLFLSPSSVGRDWGLTVSLIWEPRDLWIGAFWESESDEIHEGVFERQIVVYLCLLPCLPLRFYWWRYADEIPF